MKLTESKVNEFINTWHNLPCHKTSRSMIARFVAAPFGVVACTVCNFAVQQVVQQKSGESSA